MGIRLTPRGLALVLALVCAIGLGLVAERPAVIALGALGLSLLPVAWMAAIIARHALAATRIELSTGPAIKAALRRPLDVKATVVVPPLRVGLYGLELTPSASESLTIETRPRAPEDAELERHLILTGVRLGDGFLQGFQVRAEVALGLFAVRLWSRASLRVTVLPSRLDVGSPPLRATRAAADAQAELVHRDRRGFGMEIRELRDFAAGDPFKHIAWSASARRGKLIVREFESDLQLSVWLVVDASPSMFWGPPGQARIDHTLELACDLARSLTTGRDRVGLIVHDHEVRMVVEPGSGSLHFMRLLQHLLEVPHLVHEDRTELTDHELVERVARYWEVQEGRSFSASPTAAGVEVRPHPRQAAWDELRLTGACQNRLDATHREGRRALLPDTAYAVDSGRSTLRAFARTFGVPLPADPTPRPGGQAHGIEAALQAVLTHHGGAKSSAHSLLALTDLHTADDLDALRRVALTSRRHRHGLVFVLPTGERGVLPPGGRGARDGRLLSALIDVQDLRAEDNLRSAQAVLRPAGATFVTIAPGESLVRVLARLRAVA